MTIADLTLGAIALIAVPLHHAAAWSNVNSDTNINSVDSSLNSFKGANPSRRQLEALTSDYVDDLSILKAYLGTALEINLNKLPTSGVAKKTPWSGGSWFSYQDGINYKWNPSRPSPAELYATAFGMDVKTITDGVSNYDGIDSQIHNIGCTTNADCQNGTGVFLKSTSVCLARESNTNPVCIRADFNIQAGWAVASILENEPKCAVKYKDTTFQPMDIKGLLSEVYYNKYFMDLYIGQRYRVISTGFDDYGRAYDDSFRDANPGSMHIVAANMLGRLNASFIIDADPGIIADHHAVYSFKVLEQTAFSASEAAKTFYGFDSYSWNTNAKSIVYVKSSLTLIDVTYTDGGLVDSGRIKDYMKEVLYTYLLELDSEGNIIGGEWIKESNALHPDVIWMQKAKLPQDYATKYGLRYADVEMLVEKSVACSG